MSQKVMFDKSPQEAEYRALLDDLSGTQPIRDGEEGFCMWCYKNCDCDRRKSTHEPDCLWVKVRLALGDNLPE